MIKGDSIVSTKNYNNAIKEFNVKYRNRKRPNLNHKQQKSILLDESSLHDSYTDEENDSAYNYSDEENEVSDVYQSGSAVEEEDDQELLK